MIIGYVGGIFFLLNDFPHAFDADNIIHLLVILCLGSLAYCFFFYAAFISNSFIDKKIMTLQIIILDKIREPTLDFKVVIISLSSMAIIFYLYSYISMGFVPMFADDPMSAKFFAQSYQDTYRPVAHYFRIALNLSSLLFPFLIILTFLDDEKSNKLIFALLFVCLTILTVLTLRRGMIASAIMNMLLCFALYYKRGKFMVLMIIFYFLVYSMGSISNSLFLYFLGMTEEINLLSVFWGMPDVVDLCEFWDSFITSNYEYSMGRTIFGGMVPYHYDWNPAVVTKLVIGASPDTPSGGFRLPFQVEGYYTFGILGVFLWSSFYGVVGGLYLKYIKHIIDNDRMEHFLQFFVLIFFTNMIFSIGIFLIKMQIDQLFNICVAALIILSTMRKFPYLSNDWRVVE